MPHKLILGIVLTFPLSSVMAAQVDFEQEIVIIAKKQSSDLKNKVASYMEDVKITQGTLSIEADLVQVSNQPNGVHKIYLAKGKPARFSQILDDGQKIELQANEISYSPATQIITIKGNASVSQEGSMVKGDIITYNIATEQLSAESSSAVTTILQPEPKHKLDDSAEKPDTLQEYNEVEQEKEQQL
ncbi:lipopolysaccharide transport periplasmic protein LptA [Thalassotalea sp. 42_200_T64]|nr:lipopolysaccharide transport periplasmic protein LptA [Thalassotalea sp. 42_200_T64]